MKHEERLQGIEWVQLVACVGMMGGMFFSRALLSFFMLLVFCTALLPAQLQHNFNRWRNSKFALFSLSFFLIYLVSGLWSLNMDAWLADVTVKIPFAFLPFGMLALPLNKPRFRTYSVIGIIVLQMIVVGYSLTMFYMDTAHYTEGYHRSVSLPTTKYNDHIRFSISLVMSIVMILYMLFDERSTIVKPALKRILAFTGLLFAVYLHLLAAKAGVLCFYVVLLVFFVVKAAGRSRLLALFAGLALCALPLAAYWSVPTFRTKVDYVFYEISKTNSDGRYDYTLSDAGRMITYEIGLKYIAQHPWGGAGAGDLMDEMRKGYQQYYPEVPVTQQYGPTNQFLFTAFSVGIPLSLFLVAMVISMFTARVQNRLYLFITGLVMLIGMMPEAMLELQFGVFTYLFYILFWISAFGKKPEVN